MRQKIYINLKEKVKFIEENLTKEYGINEELKEEIKTKDTTMKETENKAEISKERMKKILRDYLTLT